MDGKNQLILNKDKIDFKEVWELTQEEWPHTAYAPMKINAGNPLKQNKENIVLIHWDGDNSGGLFNNIAESFAGGWQMLGRAGEDTNMATLSTTSKLNVDGVVTEEKRRISNIKIYQNIMSQNAWEDVYNKLNIAIDGIQLDGATEIAILNTKEYEIRLIKMSRCLTNPLNSGIEFFTARPRKGSQVTFADDPQTNNRE